MKTLFTRSIALLLGLSVILGGCVAPVEEDLEYPSNIDDQGRFVDGKADGDHGLPETIHLPYAKGSTFLHYLKVDEVNLRSGPNGDVINRNGLGLKGDAFHPTGRTEKVGEHVWLEGDLERKEEPLRGWVADIVLAQAKAYIDTTGPRTIVVNLVENRLYYFEDSALVREWNVGTGRNLNGSRTPSGTFKVNVKDECPPYSNHGVSHPGCSPYNPLGEKALWFYNGYLYGLHGTISPELLEEGTTSPSRRVSGGCVRNTNQDMAWLYDRIQVGDRVVVEYFDSKTVLETFVIDCSQINDASYRSKLEELGIDPDSIDCFENDTGR